MLHGLTWAELFEDIITALVILQAYNQFCVTLRTYPHTEVSLENIYGKKLDALGNPFVVMDSNSPLGIIYLDSIYFQSPSTPHIRRE